MDFKEIKGTQGNVFQPRANYKTNRGYIPAEKFESKDIVSFSGGIKKSEKTGQKGFFGLIKSVFSKNGHKHDITPEQEPCAKEVKSEPIATETETKTKYSTEEKRNYLFETANKRNLPEYDRERKYIERLVYVSDEEFDTTKSLLESGASFKLADSAISYFPDKENAVKNFLSKDLDEDFIISTLRSFKDEQIKQAEELTDIFHEKNEKIGKKVYDLNENNNLLSQIFRTSQLDSENFSRAKLLTQRENFNYSYLFDFACLGEVQFERAQSLLDDKAGESPALYIASLNDENYAEAKKLTKQGFSYKDISSVASFGDEKFSRSIDRNYFDKYPVSHIKAYIQIDDEVWKTIDTGSFIDDYAELHSQELDSLNSFYCGENMQKAGEIGFALRKYSECKNYAELNNDEKRHILSLLTAVNSDLFDENGISKKCAGEGIFVPKNQKEYCALVSDLSVLTGIKTKPVSKEAVHNFESALNSFDNINSPLRDIDFDNPRFKPSLEYSKDKFIEDVLSATQDLNEKDKKTLFNLFGFEIKEADNNVELRGYPVSIPEDAEINATNDSFLKSKAEEIKPFVEHFSENNKIKISGYPEFEKELNEITGVLPELLTKIDKKPGEKCEYTADIHTLKMLQNVVRNKNYALLNDNDKKLLKLAVLLQGINSKEGTEDKNSPENSAYDSYYILEKAGLNKKDKAVVYDLIKNINWFEEYNKTPYPEKDYNNTIYKKRIASDSAFALRRGKTFDLMKILSSAYVKTMKKDYSYYKEFKQSYENGIREIENKVKEIKSSSIYLPQTKIPEADKIKCDGEIAQKIKTVTQSGEEIENVVINLKPGLDLSSAGFEKGLKSDDLCVLVHGFDDEKPIHVLKTLSLPDSEAVLSTSYIRYGENEYHVFRPCGFITEADCDNIHAAFCKDFGSGTKKDFKTITSEYLFCQNLFRNYISDGIKSKLNLSDEDYMKFYEEASGKSITELETDNPEEAKAIREIIKETAGTLRSYGRKYNEALISSPEIKGVFCYGESGFENLPGFLKEYAAKNNLPVFYFGE